jgi:queuine tRNA-ribosyltransferase
VRPVTIEIEARDGPARAGIARTARGSFRTPCFMPVGTRGAVKLLDSSDLDGLQPQVVLANAYHLMLRPGAEVIAGLGGLHRFSGWDGHILTDSGGYQVFSLKPRVDEDGVDFRSVYDGSQHRLTPEGAVTLQEALGADIQMALDVCCPLPASRQTVVDAAERTLSWAKRAREAHTDPSQSLFGIVQGGVDAELRADCAKRTVDCEFDGYAVGGLSVGEPREEMLPALAAALGCLPEDRPRYLMGVGDPVSLVEAVALGVDMFDCVLPTRLARHGTAMGREGRFQLKAARFARDEGPVDERCGCAVCARYTRAYLRHLLAVGEPTGGRLLTLHNVTWLLRLVEEIREAIVANTLESMRKRVVESWVGDSEGRAAVG